MTRQISIAQDFSEFPAGRFRTDGPFSGERFREDVLLPILKQVDSLLIVLDGTMGYGSSFLEEAFGGLVRRHAMEPSELRRRIKFKSSDASLEQEVWHYVDTAKRDVPRVSVS